MSIKFNIIEGSASIHPGLCSTLNKHFNKSFPAEDCFFGLHFVSKDRINKLNSEHKVKKEKDCSVLSFPINPDIKNNLEDTDLGDIFISKSTAKNQGRTVEQLIVHGFMHLLDLDHESLPDLKLWEKIESEVLTQLK